MLIGYTFMRALLGATYPTAWTTWFEYHDREPIRYWPKRARRAPAERRTEGR